MEYYIGLDNGGTNTKAALYNSIGKEIAVASVDTKMITPLTGFTERDMEEMWDANCKVILEVIEKSKVNALDIAAIACAGHGKGLYLWGEDEKPAYNGIISTDNRAWQYVVKWRENGVEKEAFKKSYQHIMPCQPIAILSWMKDNAKETLNNIKWIFECKDYIRFKLTGEARGEITDYSGTNMLNLKTREYDKDLLKLFGLDFLIDKLPPLCNSMDICGKVTKEASIKTGLKEGTPVAGGMFDIDACAIATGITNEERICMIAGTWSINEYIRKEPVLDGKVLMNSIFCIPEYYLIEESSATSASNFEWFINTMLIELKEMAKNNKKELYKKIDHIIDSVEAKEFCPIFTPFLMASNVHPNAKASFVGLNNCHTRSHILRSIYEGVAFSHRYHLEKLALTRKERAKSIRLAGGVAHSRVWTEMFADVMGYPIEVVEVGETGAFGCAIACSIATEKYKDIDEATKNMVKVSDIIYPKENNIELYNKKYKLYKEVLKDLDPLWDNI